MPGCGRASPRTRSGQRGGLLESTRWTEGYTRVAELAASLPDTRLVYVADREADIVALMAQARDLGHPADWLIRSQHNRALPEGGKLWAEVLAGEALGGHPLHDAFAARAEGAGCAPTGLGQARFTHLRRRPRRAGSK